MTTNVTDVHTGFDASLPPVAVVAPGDSVIFDCPGIGLGPDASTDDLLALELDASCPHTIAGPVAVEGACAGDALVVEVLDVEVTEQFGHCVILPGKGLLPDDFPDALLRTLSFDSAGFARLTPDVRIPIQPFLGIMGVCPSEAGRHSTIPPRRVGGNLDIRHLGAGSVLTLPVEVDGALFSCGDGHAAQGDGEVCVAAIETAVRATLRFGVIPGAAPDSPTFTLSGSTERPGSASGYQGTTALGNDLYECAQDAIRAMITLVSSRYKLKRVEAYMLCSLAADLRINQIVNAPTWTVSAYLPLCVFN